MAIFWFFGGVAKIFQLLGQTSFNLMKVTIIRLNSFYS